MSITAGFMVPHPPLIIPQVGRGEEQKIQETIDAYQQVGKEIASLKPETIVVLSPHNPMYSDYFHIRKDKLLSGNFAQFRAGLVEVEACGDQEFVRELCRMADQEGIPAGTQGAKGKDLDHGTMIPLYFVNQFYRDYQVVCMGLSGMPLAMHYQLGQAVRQVAEQLGRRTVVIASGDLSHYLKQDGPYGYRQEGPEYDQRIMDVMGKARFGELLEFGEDFCTQAGECGHRAFTIMAGALDGLQVQAERLSYQGTFGVGYGICTYHVTGENPERNFLSQYVKKMEERVLEQRKGEDAYLSLARKSLEYYIATGMYLKLPEGLPPEMLEKQAGAFVSIHMDGDLRGCIGTILPVCKNIAQEIIENAVSAGIRDPRFPAVTEQELKWLVYSVDILEAPERITSILELDVKNYGVIVTKGRKRGLLLPDLAGVDTPQQQVAIAKQKAGISVDDQDVMLERFRVVRHGEKS